jgi:hypothetical protein
MSNLTKKFLQQIIDNNNQGVLLDTTKKNHVIKNLKRNYNVTVFSDKEHKMYIDRKSARIMNVQKLLVELIPNLISKVTLFNPKSKYTLPKRKQLAKEKHTPELVPQEFEQFFDTPEQLEQQLQELHKRQGYVEGFESLLTQPVFEQLYKMHQLQQHYQKLSKLLYNVNTILCDIRLLSS